jgi:hypothetical protein
MRENLLLAPRIRPASPKGAVNMARFSHNRKGRPSPSNISCGCFIAPILLVVKKTRGACFIIIPPTVGLKKKLKIVKLVNYFPLVKPLVAHDVTNGYRQIVVRYYRASSRFNVAFTAI